MTLPPPEQPYSSGDPAGNRPYGNQPYGAPSYGNQQYGAPQTTPPPGSRPKGLAVTALVLGVLALLFSWTILGGIILGLAAIVIGWVAISRASKGRAGGRGMAITGVVLGVLGAVLSGLLVWFGVGLLNSQSGQDLQECIDQAAGDQAAVDDCRLQFEEDVQDELG